MKIRKYLTSDEINKISLLVAEAEKQTDGEIVPIIVQRSSSIGHVKWILLFLMTILFLAFEHLIFLAPLKAYYFLVPVIAILFFYFIAVVLQKLSWVQRLLTPKEDEVNQVQARAELEFYRKQIKNTSRRTGILIFVSLMERRVVILADEGISSHYAPETWDEVAELLAEEFKKGNMYLGFEKAIKKCGTILQSKLPITHHDTNELSNRLIIKD